MTDKRVQNWRTIQFSLIAYIVIIYLQLPSTSAKLVISSESLFRYRVQTRVTRHTVQIDSYFNNFFKRTTYMCRVSHENIFAIFIPSGDYVIIFLSNRFFHRSINKVTNYDINLAALDQDPISPWFN